MSTTNPIKPRKSTKTASENATGITNDRRPMLFTNAPMHGLSFGVLRIRFSDRDNDAAAYVSTKLAPALAAGEPWTPTAARWDVLLPPGVPDLFLDPIALANSFMTHRPPAQKDLLICLRVVLDTDAPLHESWERARAYARQTLVRSHGLPTILVLHDPTMSGQREPNAPHIHMIAMARRLAARGWAERTHLAVDEGHDILAEAWRKTVE